METRSPVAMGGLFGSMMLKSGLPVSILLGRLYDFIFLPLFLPPAFSSCSVCIRILHQLGNILERPACPPSLEPSSVRFRVSQHKRSSSRFLLPRFNALLPACFLFPGATDGKAGCITVQQQPEHLWLSENAAAADFCCSPVLLAWALALVTSPR